MNEGIILHYDFVPVRLPSPRKMKSFSISFHRTLRWGWGCSRSPRLPKHDSEVRQTIYSHCTCISMATGVTFICIKQAY